jgi:hypothetical protein
MISLSLSHTHTHTKDITTWKSKLLNGIHTDDLETLDVNKRESNEWLAYCSQEQLDL